MNTIDRITEIIFAAMRESNDAAEPGRALEISASTALVGDTGKLDSLAFVNLVISIQENIQRDLQVEIPVLDTILNGAGEEWRVSDLARRLAEQLPPAQSHAAV